MAADSVSLPTGVAAPHRKPPTPGSLWFDIVFGRTVPAVVFSVFLVDKLMLTRDSLVALAGAHGQPTDYLAPSTQVLGLGYFGLLVVLYVTRLPKRAGDTRPATVFVAFFGSFSILLAGLLPGHPARSFLQLPAALLELAGMLYAVWALVYLRRSFSILPEARRLVTGGPYSISRHPLYLGEAVAGIGVTLPTIGVPGAFLVAAFLAAQFLRIRYEERVLERQFPEYGEYGRRVPRYLPDPLALLRKR